MRGEAERAVAARGVGLGSHGLAAMVTAENDRWRISDDNNFRSDQGHILDHDSLAPAHV